VAARPRLDLSEPVLVELGPDQPHPIDLRWVNELTANLRGHAMVRPEDNLFILLPNRPFKLNKSAAALLDAMINREAPVQQILRQAGDTPEKRRELHVFFADLQDLAAGRLGEGRGRLAVTQQPFSADFCRYPVLSELAVTYRCNLKCAFCYASSPALQRQPNGQQAELTTAEAGRILECIRRDARCPSVSFTGGEPTLRRDLPDLTRRAKAVGLRVNLISNGTLLDARLTNALAKAGLDSAQISLEGPSAETHDAAVGCSGAFGRLWGGVERLRDVGVTVHTNTTVTRANIGLLSAVIDLIAARGLDKLTMNLMIPCGSAIGRPDLTVRYSEIGPAALAARTYARQLGLTMVWYSPLPLCLFNTAAHGFSNHGCAAADGLLHVNPAGDVLPCSSFPPSGALGNLLRQPFRAIWDSPAARHYREKQMMPALCRTCGKNQICQGACVLYWNQLGRDELPGEPPWPMNDE